MAGEKKWHFRWGCASGFFVLLAAYGIYITVINPDSKALDLPPAVEAILETLLAIVEVAVVLFLIELFFQEVLDSSLLLCFNKDGWREKPISCIIGIIIFAIAVVFVVSVFFGVLLYGSEPMPNNYDYIRNDEPYRTWP